MSLRIVWRPSAERDLIVGVARWKAIASIDAAVRRVAEAYVSAPPALPIERFDDHPTALRLRVLGGRVVTLLVDARAHALVVLSMRAAPDPYAAAHSDEPLEWDEDGDLPEGWTMGDTSSNPDTVG